MNVKYTYILLISFVFLCSGTSAPAQQKGSQLKLKTVVIDPGHGGKERPQDIRKESHPVHIEAFRTEDKGSIS